MTEKESVLKNLFPQRGASILLEVYINIKVIKM